MEKLKPIISSVLSEITPDRIGLVVTIAGSFLLGTLYNESRFFGESPGGVVRWLEKWQTLLTGFAAFAAAFPVYRQLSEMRRQSSAVAMSSYEAILAKLEEERTAVRTVTRAAFTLRSKMSRPIDVPAISYHTVFDRQFDDLVDAIRSNINNLEDIGNRVAVFSELSSIRLEYVSRMRSVLEHLDSIFAEFVLVDRWANGQVTADAYEPGSTEYSDEFKRRRDMVDSAAQLATPYHRHLTSAIERTFSAVANAQKSITGLS